MAILGMAILICGGMLTGVLWQQKLDAGKSPESNFGAETQFDFSEEGVRAAAVTLMGGFGSGGDYLIPSSVDIVVSINKPFLYLVRDVKTGDVWFMGTVYEPNLWENDHVQYGQPY